MNQAKNGNGVDGQYAAIGEVPDDVVRVLRGAPDEDELAALVAGIVATRAGGHEEIDDGSRTSLWTNHGHRLGLPPSAARAAWRWSAHAQH
ncbi:acyl-CoA carboxylase subunit epsilon [Pseudactinotalea sp. Z1739]|uniref:acyl-CoA carboxylase subunit epsilon n=1 Tax=Pseudactinotalea sp. Z1739 TaxID=3413028 RepID=UPI003C79AD31